MRPRPPIRKMVKWGGLAVFVLACAAGAWSRWAGRSWDAGGGWAVILDRGEVGVGRWFGPGRLPEGLHRNFSATTMPFEWQVCRGSPPPFWIVAASLWTPALLGAASWAVAWRLDVRAARRICGTICRVCRYDRTGLAPSAPCPECGAGAR